VLSQSDHFRHVGVVYSTSFGRTESQGFDWVAMILDHCLAGFRGLQRVFDRLADHGECEQLAPIASRLQVDDRGGA
jgi:hypothetical protein